MMNRRKRSLSRPAPPQTTRHRVIDKRRRALKNLRCTGLDGPLRSFGREELRRKLRGGASRNRTTSRFSWPYVPYPTKSSTAAFFERWLPSIKKLVKTRYNSDYKHSLRPGEITHVNASIDNNLKRMDVLSKQGTDSFAELFFVIINFLNKVKITNITEHTEVILPQRSDTTPIPLRYDEPVATRLEYLKEGKTVIIDKRRSSRNLYEPPIKREIFISKDDIEVEAKNEEECVLVTIKVVAGNRAKDVTLRVEWFGPYTSLYDDGGVTSSTWEDRLGEKVQNIKTLEEHRYSTPELIHEWIPILRQSRQTLDGPLHRKYLSSDERDELITIAENVIADLEQVARYGGRYLEILRTLNSKHRIFTETPGVVVYVQLSEGQIFCLSSDFCMEWKTRLAEIKFAELYLQKTGEFIPIERKHVDVIVVDDYLEVKITPRRDTCVVLSIYWMGPVNDRVPAVKYKDIFGLSDVKDCAGLSLLPRKSPNSQRTLDYNWRDTPSPSGRDGPGPSWSFYRPKEESNWRANMGASSQDTPRSSRSYKTDSRGQDRQTLDWGTTPQPRNRDNAELSWQRKSGTSSQDTPRSSRSYKTDSRGQDRQTLDWGSTPQPRNRDNAELSWQRESGTSGQGTLPSNLFPTAGPSDRREPPSGLNTPEPKRQPRLDWWDDSD